MFIRESEGVYMFGQKRVYIKVEKGNQIQVRVGGGFMAIDEFVKSYTEVELEKVERRDALKRFMCKVATQSIAVSMANGAVESLPISAPQNPPRRTSIVYNSPRKSVSRSPTKTVRNSLSPIKSVRK
jgi:hypothetical protein